MSLSNLTSSARLLLDRKVSYVIFAITSRCNALCPHCFYWENIKNSSQRKELSLDEIQKISLNLGNLLLLNLCGGEPYLRDDLPEIARIFSKNNKVKYITVPSNGLETERIIRTAEKLLRENPKVFFRFGVSIDGIKEVHDTIRGIKGLFEKVTQTIHGLNSLKRSYRNFFIVSSTIFSHYTQNHILETLRYIKENLPVDQTAVTFIRGNPYKPISKDVHLNEYSDIVKYLNERSQVSRHPLSKILNSVSLLTAERVCEAYNSEVRPFECFGGTKLIVIDDIGNVSPCEILSERFGNLRECNYNINELLSSEEARSLIRFIREKRCNCTWECAIQSSLIFNVKEYPRILRKAYQVARLR